MTLRSLLHRFRNKKKNSIFLLYSVRLHYLCKRKGKNMEIINLSDTNSILGQYLSEIRDKDYQQNRLLFRNNIMRIGEYEAFEISKSLEYVRKEVTTPLGTAVVNVPKDKILLGTIFRAGLPFHQGFLNIFDHAGNAFVSAYREYTNDAHTEVGIHVEYLATPSVDEKVLIIADPMLATGGSACDAISLLKKRGVKNISFMAIIGCPEGIKKVSEEHPDVKVFVSTCDRGLNENCYILPGLGDAGDRLFGTK